jgi:lysophospholipase L1-like esterase
MPKLTFIIFILVFNKMNVKKKIKNEQKSTKFKTPIPILILILTLIIFVFQEILFRILFPIPDILNFNRINYSPVFFGASSQELKYLSNASFIWASDPDQTESLIELNLYGFRGKNFKAAPDPETPRLIFIGDSFVEGYLAKEDESISSNFKNEASKNDRNLNVINLGIGGTDFTNYCKLLSDAVPALLPDHVFIILHANDLPPQPYVQDVFDRHSVPEYSHCWVPRIYYVVSNFINGKTVPKRWESKPFTFFAPVPAPSNPWSNTETEARYNKFISAKVSQAMKKGRFNPFSVDEYTQFKDHLPLSFKITEHLNGIQNYMAKYGKKFYIVYIPSRNQVSDYYLQFQKEFSSESSLVPLTGPEYQIHAKIMKESCNSLGIPFYDCTEIIKIEENSGNHLYWNYDEHMHAKGYSLIGKHLYSWWKTARKL